MSGKKWESTYVYTIYYYSIYYHATVSYFHNRSNWLHRQHFIVPHTVMPSLCLYGLWSIDRIKCENSKIVEAKKEIEELSSSVDVIMKYELILSFILKQRSAQKNKKKKMATQGKSRYNRNTHKIKCWRVCCGLFVQNWAKNNNKKLLLLLLLLLLLVQH